MYRNNQSNHLSESWNSRWSSHNNSPSPSSTEISLTSSSTPSPSLPASRSSTSSLPTIRSPRYSPYAMSSPHHTNNHVAQPLVIANGPSSLTEASSVHRYHHHDHHEEEKFDLEKTYPSRPRTKSENNDDPTPADAAKGLLSCRAFTFLILWYIFSALTLFLNKYILDTLKGDPTMLSKYFFMLCQN